MDMHLQYKISVITCASHKYGGAAYGSSKLRLTELKHAVAQAGLAHNTRSISVSYKVV